MLLIPKTYVDGNVFLVISPGLGTVFFKYFASKDGTQGFKWRYQYQVLKSWCMYHFWILLKIPIRLILIKFPQTSWQENNSDYILTLSDLM